MAEIDSLEIKITANAEKANTAIRHLARSLGALSTSLKFDTTSLEKLGKINGNNFKKLGEGLQSFANASKSLQNVDSNNFKKLSDGLTKIASIDSSKLETLGKIDGNSFRGLGEGVKSLSSGLQNLQGVKKSDFNRLASGIERLAAIQPGKMETVGNALRPLADGVNILSNAKFDNKNLQNLINSLTRLVNANTGSLVNIDFTTLGNSINSLAQTLSRAEEVKQNTISMTNAIAKLSNAGENANIVSQALPQLGIKLREFMWIMSNAPKLESETIAFTQALAQLANAGKKAEETASWLPRLGESLRTVFDNMSHVPAISDNTIAFTQALAQLANAGNRSNASLKTLGTNLGKTSVSMNGLMNITKKATLNLKSMAKQILASAGIYVSIYGAIRGLKNAIKSSMDYVETLNYFNAAFGQVAEKADLSNFKKMGYESAESYFNSFSERAEQITQKMTGFKVSDSGMLLTTGEKNLGINPEQLMNYQSIFAQMSSSMGVTSENALTLSDVLTKIGADLASVKNMDFNKVWTDMSSGLAGMSRTLDKYGTNIRNVNLQQKLNELGINANITALNQNDKALLRTIILLDSTRYAWGDMSRTIEQPANQLRLIKSNFSNLSRTIGNIFLPIIAKVLPYVNAITIALQRLAEKIVLLLGFENFEWGGLGKVSGASDILSQIYDDTENVTDAMGNATKKAKEFQNQLLGFDEVYKLTEPTEDTTTTDVGLSGPDAGALDEAFKNIASEYQAVWNKAFEEMENRANKIADNIINAFKNKDYKGIGTYISNSISNALDSINWESVYQGAKNFGTGLAEFLNGLITPDLFGNVGETIAGFLNTKIYTALSFGEAFDFKKFGESIARGINNFFETFDFGALAETFNVWVQGFADSFISFMSNVDWSNILKGAWDFLKEIDLETVGIIVSVITFKVAAKVIKRAVTTTLLPVITRWFSINSLKFFKIGIAITVATIAIKIAQDKLEPIFDEYDLEEIKKASQRMFEDWFGKNPISATLSDIFVFESTLIAEPSEIKDALKLLWDDVCSGDFKFNLFNLIEFPSYNEITESLSDAGKAISDWWNENVAPWFTKKRWIELWEDAKNGMEEGWNKLKDWWNNTAIVKWWDNDVAPWFTKKRWISAMHGVKEAFETTWNNAISSIKEIWNKFANWLNDKLTWEIKPIKIAGKKIFRGATIDLGKIPTFATGGYPNTEKPFIVGENGAEIMGGMYGKPTIANSNSITDGIRQAAYEGMIRALMETNEKSNSGVILRIEGDPNGMFRVMQEEAKSYVQKTGNSPFVV